MEAHTLPPFQPYHPAPRATPFRSSGAPSSDYCRALRSYAVVRLARREPAPFTNIKRSQRVADGEAYHEAA